MNKKKILIVSDTWTPQVNGVVTSFKKIIALLEADGFEVVVAHPGLFKNVPLLLYPEIRLTLAPGRAIRRVMKAEQPDFIHIANEGPLGYAARSYCLKHKIPFTSSYHTHFPLYIPYYVPLAHKSFTRVSSAYLRWFHNASQKTLVCSLSLKKDLAKQGFRHLGVWPLGVDAVLFKKNKAVKRTYPGPVYVYFGRLAKEKGLDEFLSTKIEGSKLIIGDGPARKTLEKKFGHEAHFLGYKRGQELIDLLSMSDVFVMPSRTETFGLVIVEALACELPVAAHNVMGPKDIVAHKKEGYLSDDLAEAMTQALKLRKKPLRQKALQFSWEKSKDIFLKQLVSVSGV